VDLPRTGARIRRTYRGQVPESEDLPRTRARMQGTYQGRVPESSGLAKDKSLDARDLPRTGARIRRSHRGQVPECKGLTRYLCKNPKVHSYRGHLPESGGLTEDGCQNPEVFQSSFVPEADPHSQVTNHLPRADREYLLERTFTKSVIIFRFKKIIFYPRKYWRRYSPFL
jgi:hypothetical protein